jgi:ribonuclease VapC
MNSSPSGTRKQNKRIMSSVLLDSSAVLAALFEEPGMDMVRERGTDASITTVNYCEVLSKLADHGVPVSDAVQLLADLNLEIQPITTAHAIRAAEYRTMTRHHNFALADRLCLACANIEQCPVLTADKNWLRFDFGAEVIVIRP